MPLTVGLIISVSTTGGVIRHETTSFCDTTTSTFLALNNFPANDPRSFQVQTRQIT